ncbi:GNAT family N-acetyltransferase [Arenibacter echinorum]|uniref:Ribosomal-protein-alanine N-acetyltransferase n=1 Tax=Arenibacter echinorum TaxID=440515 RepID=A0A327RIY1_9FLAO|nr:GNAT family N-acetyltransferase [Arenibacter echinorum]RAJ15982.1 ribosomal-protein-alanine N-acetyltransferase [Arenibacter echinorum]
MNSINNFQELETNRLHLRRLEETDWPMIRYLRSDKEVNKFVNRQPAETKEKALAFIAKTNNDINNGQLYQWCISLKNIPEMIGNICLWNFSQDYKTAEMGYDLSPKFQGRGIMDEAMKAVLNFGFIQLKLDLIEAFTNKQNLSSKKLLLRNNFKWNTSRNDPDDPGNLIYEIYKENYPCNP